MSFRDDLKAYLDGELPPVRMAEMREAIDRDPSLAQELSELESLAVAVQAYAPRSEAVGLDQTLAALNRSSRRRAAWYAWPLGLAGAGAVAFGLLFPIFMKPEMRVKTESVAFKGGIDRSVAGSVAMDVPKGRADLAAPLRPRRRDFWSEATAGAEAAKAQRAPLSPQVAPLMDPLGSSTHRPLDAAESPHRGPGGPGKFKSVEPGLKAGTDLHIVKPQGTPVRTPPSEGLKKSADGASYDAIAMAPSASSIVREQQEASPIVIEVASMEEAQTRLEALASRFDGRLQTSPVLGAALRNDLKRDTQLKAEATERKLVLDVPESKAADAIQAVREVARQETPALSFMRRSAGGMRGALGDMGQNRSEGSANSGTPPATVTGSGQGGGGMGGGGFGGGNGGPGGPGGGAPAGGTGKNVGSTAKPAPVTAQASEATSKMVAPPRRRIVIVIRTKAPAKKATPPLKESPSPENSSAGNL